MLRVPGRDRAIVILLLLTLGVLPRCSWGQADNRIGTVLLVEGSTDVQTQATSRWEPLGFRDAIFANDTVRTGRESKVKVLLRDDSIMTLAENSELQFTEFLLASQQRRTIVTLTIGTLRVLTARLFGAGSITEVRTANTVAGVRGTTFVVRFIPPETTEVISLEGVVTVRNRDATVPQIQPVPSNFRTQVVGAAPPDRAVEISTETARQLVQEVRVIEQIPKEVLTSEKLQSLDTPRDSTRASAEGSRAPEPAAVIIPANVREVAPAPVSITSEKPALQVGSTPQMSVITPDSSPAAVSRVKVRLIFPGR